MQRRVERANGNRESVHRLEYAFEILALHGQQFLERRAAVFFVVGENHGAHVRNFLLAEEHVLGTAKANAFGAKGSRLNGIAGDVGIGADLHRAVRVGPVHEFFKLGIVRRGVERVQLALDHASGRAVERDPVAGPEGLAFDAHLARFFIDVDVAGARYAAFAHAARDDGGVAGHATARSENALGDFHAVDVFRRGFGAHQNHGNISIKSRFFHGFVGGKNDLSNGRARRRGQALRQHLDFASLFIEARHEEVIQLIRIDAENRFFLGDQPFVHHLQRHANRGQSRALTVARLQHVEFAILNGELEILHVLVMLLQPRRDITQLVINIGHDLFEFEDWNRSAHAGNHIFALRVQQEFSVEFFRAVGRIARESDTGAAGIAEVAEDHGLHIDRRPEHVIDVVDAAIVLGAIVLPGAEHGIARHHQLLDGVLRKVALGVLLDGFLVVDNDLLQRLRVKAGVELGLLLVLLGIENLFEDRFLDVEHDVAEHLNQPAIGVVGEARVVGAFGQGFDALVVEAEVEDRIHHAGHGKLRARTHAHQQRVVAFTELLALERFELGQCFLHLAVDVFRDGIAHVFAAGLGLDGESGRHREPGVSHFGKPGALTTENVFHLAVAVGLAAAEGVDILCGRGF